MNVMIYVNHLFNHDYSMLRSTKTFLFNNKLEFASLSSRNVLSLSIGFHHSLRHRCFFLNGLSKKLDAVNGKLKSRIHGV